MSVPGPSRAHSRSFLFLVLVNTLLWTPSAGAEMAVALNAKDDSISLIDTQTDQEVARSSIGKEPHHLMAIRMIITSSLPMPQVTNWCSSTLCAVKSSVG